MSAHDVRKLACCSICGDLGMDGAGLIKTAKRTLTHPRCYERREGRAALLALPMAELNKVRLCDVTLTTMRLLCTAAEHGKRGEP